jgi:outer membrane protein
MQIKTSVYLLPKPPMSALVAISALLIGMAAVSSAQVRPATPVVVAPSDSTIPSPPIKVATIFGQNAISSTQEGQKTSAALTAKYGPSRDQYNRKEKELQALRDQLKRGQATMSADARTHLNQAIDDKSRELDRLGQDSQAALEQEEGAIMQQMGEKLYDVIRDYATRNGYAVVLDVSLPNGPVLWASPLIDITNDIVKLYDQAHPVAATPRTAPPPPAKK